MLVRPAVLLLTTVFLAVPLLAPTGSVGATLCVDAAGGACEVTIVAGVAAAQPGDTLDVAAGTYPEQVTIDKPLTLRGPNVGRSVDATRVAEADVTGALFLTSSNITIDGLRFSGLAWNVYSAKISPSDSTEVDDVTIRSNRFENIRGYAVRHRHNGLAVPALQAQDHRWSVTDNVVAQWQDPNVGAFQMWGISDMVVSRNRVTRTPDGASAFALQANTSPGAVIEDNEFTGMSSALQVSASWLDVSNVLIARNRVSSSGQGLVIRPDVAMYTISDVHVVENHVSGNQYTAISIHGGSIGRVADIEFAYNVIDVDAAKLLAPPAATVQTSAIDLPFNSAAPSAHGHVEVHHNVITFTGVASAGITPIGVLVRGEAQDVDVHDNVIDGGGVVAGAGATTPATSVLVLTAEVATGPPLAGASIRITSNQFTKVTTALAVKDTQAGTYTAPPIGVLVVFAGNVVTQVPGLAVASGGTGEVVDARDNAWDCGDTLDTPGCPTSAGLVDASDHLILEVHVDQARVETGSTGTVVTADLTRNQSGALVSVLVSDDVQVTFGTNLGAVPVRRAAASGHAVAPFTPGATTGTATVTASVGGLVGEVEVTIVAAAAPPTVGGPAGVTTPGPVTPAADPDDIAPQLTRLSLSPARFRAGTGRVSFGGTQPRTGTTMRWHLNRAGTVRLTVSRRVRGRMDAGRCAASTRANAHGRPCMRYVAVPGIMRRLAAAGVSEMRFTGAMNKRALRPGSYRLAATPASAPRGTKPVFAAFTILR
ncbi:MAG: hypothetical protein JWN72_2487 [Thermoleophilia bacterium]|nr:hypothetical protein [Thermoleophilia bacterium]